MKRLARLTVGAALAAMGVMLGSGAPAAASAVCPPAPSDLADLISVDATYPGSLTEAFRPIYGVYAEGAAACWPAEVITIAGFVASPEGLGGARPFTIEPGWMVSLAHFLSVSDRRDPDAGPVGPFLPVAVPPVLEARFSSLEGRWVRVSGHFDDPGAMTCVAVPTGTDLDGVPTPEEAIAICRTSFVLSSVEALSGPPTDAVAPRATLGMAARFGETGVVVVIVAGMALGVALRRYESVPGRHTAATGTS
jgi:hypothetical protein